MNSSIFTPEKKNKFRSLHYSPKKSQIQGNNSQLNINGTKQSFKPQFLYFTHRERQKIQFFQNSSPNIQQSHFSNLNNLKQQAIKQKFSDCFQKTFKLRSKYFDIKKLQHSKSTQIFPKKQTNLLIQGKSKPTVKRRAFFNKNEVPSVGMYDAKPQKFMKRLAKNEIFRKGKSCHQIFIYQNKENIEDFILKNSSQNFSIKKGQKTVLKANWLKDCIKNKNIFGLTNYPSEQIQKKQKKPQKSSQNKIKIKCFDMSKQTSRFSIKTLRAKNKQLDSGSDYIQKTYKRSMFMPVALNQAQLQNLYNKKKQKYNIDSAQGILKYIKLQDFIKTHRNQSIEQQNYQ